MQSWHTTYLGLRELPRDISTGGNSTSALTVIDRGKPLVAQSHQNPALHHLNGGFDLAFVLRVVGPCGQHGGAVVPRKVVHRLVGPGLVAIRIGYQGFGVVGHDELGHTAKEAQGLGGGTQPVGHGLARCGASEGVA